MGEVVRAPGDQIAREARDRVIGKIPFAIDHAVPGMVHARTLRSPYPHATITAIDRSEAAAMPGVIAVITGEDLAGRDGLIPYFGDVAADQPAVAIDKVRYAGEIVAVVVAETRAIAEDALRFIDVEYEELPVIGDTDAALAPSAPLIHGSKDSNVCQRTRLRHGDIDEGWELADRVYDHVYSSPTASHVPLEAHAAIATYSSDGLEVWTGAQAPYKVRTSLAQMFGFEPESVRVHGFDLGGGFGAKTGVMIEPTVAVASFVVGRPVRLELTRDEVFFTVAKHGARIRLRTGVKDDGTFVARHVDLEWNVGAYGTASPRLTVAGAIGSIGPYRFPHAAVDSVACYTNTVPAGPFRGAMYSQVAWAYESQIDEIAADLGIPPMEMRRRNLLADGDHYATGEKLDHLFTNELLEEVDRAVQLDPSPAPPGHVRGKGVGVIMKSTITPSRSDAALRLEPDGLIHILASGVEMGQGATETMIRLAAEYLDLPLEKLRRPPPDTAITPFDTSTSGSRTTFSTGVAIRDAASELQRRLSSLAAPQLGVAASELRHAGGSVTTADGTRSLSYGDVVTGAGLDELLVTASFETDGGIPSLDPETSQGKASIHWHQGAAAAVIEVDVATGKISVLKCHGASYVGRAVDATRVRQQNEGCVIFGLGPALFEELVFDEGQIVNPNMGDYMIPSILDIPRDLTSSALESPEPGAELHGAGEMALPAVAPAIANALFDATGARIRDLPLTPEKVLRVLEHKVRGGSDE